jgi:hypothetical protein
MKLFMHHFRQHKWLLTLPLLVATTYGNTAFAAPTPTFSMTASGTTTSQTLVTNVIGIADADIGKNINVYLGFLFNQQAYFKDTRGWVPYNGGVVPIYSAGPFANQAIEVVRNADMTPLIGGQVFLGYGLSESDMVTNHKYAMLYAVAADTIAPTVSGTINANGDTGVAINSKIGATFSKEMKAATVNNTSFSVKEGTTTIPGSVAYTGVTAVFTPTGNLAYNTTYTATISTAVKDLAGNPLASDYVWHWTTGLNPDVTAPKVSSTINANGANGVATNTKVGVTFSEAMDPLTLTTTTLTLKRGTILVPGTVVYSGVTAIFTPTNTLFDGTLYTVTVTTGAKDLAGNALASNFVNSWTTAYAYTAPPADTTAPLVNSSIPANAAPTVAINTAESATFSEAMDPLSITNVNYFLKGTLSGTLIPGTVSYSGVTAVFTPSTNLAANTGYTITVKGGGSGVKDLAGNPLASDQVISWSTAANVDVTAPTVTGTVNANGAVNVAVNSTAGATFSEGLDPLTVTSANFTLKETVSGNAVAGLVSYSGVDAVFTPTSNLTSSLSYTATIKGGVTGVKDLASNPLASDFVWSWTTAGHGPSAIDLQTSGDFAILTETGITNTGASVINGNIGASPITATAMDNVPCSAMASGVIYGVDAAYTGSGDVTCFHGAPADKTLVDNAVGHMATAYTNAAGAAAGTGPFLNVGAGTLTNKTLVPGVYTFGTGVSIPTNLTLAGGANDVWIFEIAATLDLAANKQILLTGGALAKNVFWQVGGVVTLLAGAHFEGNILAQTNIALLTGASINGRMLAQTAVTLQANTVTKPAP